MRRERLGIWKPGRISSQEIIFPIVAKAITPMAKERGFISLA